MSLIFECNPNLKKNNININNNLYRVFAPEKGNHIANNHRRFINSRLEALYLRLGSRSLIFEFNPN